MIVRWMMRIFLWTFAALVIAAGLTLAAFRIDHVRLNAFLAIEHYLDEHFDMQVRVESVSGFLPFHWNIRNFELDSGGRPLLRIDRLEFALSPLDSLFGSLTFGFVSLEEVKTFGGEGESNGIPTLPPLSIRSLRIKQQGYLFEGALESRLSDQSLWVEGFLSDSAHPESALEVHSSLSLTNEALALALHLQEAPRGFLSRRLPGDVLLPFSLGLRGHYDFKTGVGLGELFGMASCSLQEGTYPLTASGEFEFNDAGVKVKEILLSCQDVKVRGKGFVDRVENELQFKLKSDPIPAPLIGSHVKGSINVSGSLERPALNFTLSAEEGLLYEQALGKLRLRYNAEDLFTLWRGRLGLHGKINGKPFEVSFNTDLEENGFYAFSNLHATWAETHLQGLLHLSSKTWLPHGHLEGQCKALDKIDPSLGGALAFNAQLLRASEERRQLTLQVQGNDLSFGDISIGKLTLKQKIDDLWGAPEGEAALGLVNAVFGDQQFEQISLATAFSARRQSWPFTVNATGKRSEDPYISGSGQWHSKKEELFIHFSMLEGKLFDYPLSLKRPVNILWADDELRLSKLELALGEAEVLYEAALQPDQIFLQFDVSNLPVDIVNLFLTDKLSMRGTLSSVCRVKGPLGQVQGALTLDVNDVEIFDEVFAKLPLLSGNFEAILSGETLRFSGGIRDPATEPVVLKGTVPLELSLFPWKVKRGSDQRLDVHLKAAGDVTPFLEFFVTDTTNIGGNIDVNVHLGGTWDDPKVAGHAELIEGSYESLNTGLLINNIDARFVGNGRRLVLESLHGVDGKGGALFASGNVEINSEEKYPFALHVDLSRARLLRLDYAEVETTGKLTFKGTAERGMIEGAIKIDKAEIDLPTTTPIQMRTVDVTYVNLPDKQKPEPKKKPWPIDLNVALTVPDSFRVDGKNLESEWQGRFLLTGTTTNPLLNGNLQIIRGEYSFNGKEFVSTQGSINFAGEPGAKTTLYILGEQQIDRYKIGIIVKGSISSPQLGFRSNPPLSEKEILSWILFNRSVDEITPFQVAKLSQMAFSFGSSDGEDFMTRLQNQLGVDRIDISSEEIEDHNEISLRVGKYISNGVMVSLSKSITAEANQVAIEAKLARDFKVQAEVGDNAEGKMTIKWERDY